jgi:hypothetical protein
MSTACAIGNSSSFVRDASYFGTPVVLVGDRQEGRETDIHVARVAPSAVDVAMAIRKQLRHGRYPASTLYGDGNVSARIADALVAVTPYRQKRLHYIYDTQAQEKGTDYASAGHHNGAGKIQGDSAEEYSFTDGKAAAGLHG